MALLIPSLLPPVCLAQFLPASFYGQGWRGWSLASRKEGTKGEVGLCSLLRGTKLRPLFALGQRLRGRPQITRKERTLNLVV